MAKKVLTDVKMGGNECSTYLGSVDGVLRAANLWDDEFYKLAGMTGMAFHFIVHETACPSSVTVYDWYQEHQEMMDRIGILSENFVYTYSPEGNTAAFLQEQARMRIRESIERGVGVVVWTPTPLLEFGIINGYDDDDEVYMVKDCCCGSNPDPLLYSNLGKSDVSLLAYQIFYGQVQVPQEKIIRESLLFGLKEWKKEFHINARYGSGRKGYQNLLQTLQKGNFNPFGLAYIISSYYRSKECLAQYLQFLVSEDKSYTALKDAAQLYQQIAQKFSQMAEIIPFSGQGKAISLESVAKVAELVQESYQLEEQAMAVLEGYLSRLES